MKIMKKILCTVLVVVMCLTSAPLGGFVGLELPEWNWKASAVTEIISTGKCGENTKWTLYDDGKLVVSGSGAINDYKNSISVPWYSNRSSINRILVGDEVTKIGDYAFEATDIIVECYIGKNVKEYSEYSLPNHCQKYLVHSDNKYFCSDEGVLFNKQKNILLRYPDESERDLYVIPDSVEIVSEKAFSEDSWMFDDEYNLEKVVFGKNIKRVEDDAFSSCRGLKEVVFNEKLVYIGIYAFAASALIEIKLPNSLITIDNSAFFGCSNLEKVSLGYSTESIGEMAFQRCDKLKIIEIYENLKTIGSQAFYMCDDLEDIYYSGSESQWNKINIGKYAFDQIYPTKHYNSLEFDDLYNPDNPDNPNNPSNPNPDNPDNIKINFEEDTYEVEVDYTVTVSAIVTCPAGVENSNLDMVWEIFDSYGTEILYDGEYSNFETKLNCYAEIRGLNAGTYYINLRDKNSGVSDSAKIHVYEYYHPETPPKPHIQCDNTTVEYKQSEDCNKRKKFTINGHITNDDEEHTLTDISITIKSPDANKAVFKTENGYKESVTFPLGKTIETGKSRDFKCTAYIKRGYNPPNGAEDLTFTCILHGKLDGKEVNGIYSTFNVKIKNSSYENPDENKNWTTTSLIGLLDILFTSKPPKGERLYIDCYPDKSAASTLKWQYTSIKSINAVASTIKLSEELSKALNVAIKLTETGNISAVKIQDKIFGLAEKALNKVMDAYKDKAMNEIQKFYDGEIKRLLESEEYKEYLEWYSREVNYINGNSTKVTKRCPIDIFVTDEEGCNILKIEDSDIDVYDEYASAYLSGDDKIIYLPNDIGHSIKTVATGNGEMDYIIESYSKQGEYRIIEYNNIPLIKGKSYTATVPLDMTSNIDMFNPKSEDGKIIKADKDITEHKYGDKDKNCQLCGFDRTKDCSCNCHAGGIKKFFFKFLLFFQKIFRTNKECKCGIKHY